MVGVRGANNIRLPLGCASLTFFFNDRHDVVLARHPGLAEAFCGEIQKILSFRVALSSAEAEDKRGSVHSPGTTYDTHMMPSAARLEQQ